LRQKAKVKIDVELLLDREFEDGSTGEETIAILGGMMANEQRAYLLKHTLRMDE